MITLYTAPSFWGLPSISPPCMKLETWLRMAKLPYQAVIVTAQDFAIAPKGKIPFINYQGKLFGDSTLIIEMLKQAEGIDLEVNLTCTERAISLAFRRMIKENIYWGVSTHLSEDFTAINPLQRIPVIIDNGLRIVESLAILDYLEAKYPTPSLMPSEIDAIATVRISNEPLWQKEPIICNGKTIKLVAEVVSTNWQDDYARKVEEYAVLGIPEFWIVDFRGLGGSQFIGNPKQPTFTVCQLIRGTYQQQKYRLGDTITSYLLPNLQLKLDDVMPN